jgi:hypothetical protein
VLVFGLTIPPSLAHAPAASRSHRSVHPHTHTHTHISPCIIVLVHFFAAPHLTGVTIVENLELSRRPMKTCGAHFWDKIVCSCSWIQCPAHLKPAFGLHRCDPIAHVSSLSNLLLLRTTSNDVSTPTRYEAIYLVEPTVSNAEKIKADFSDKPLYAAAHVFFTDTAADAVIRNMAHPKLKVRSSSSCVDVGSCFVPNCGGGTLVCCRSMSASISITPLGWVAMTARFN